MIELPEALTISRQLNEAIIGKEVSRVLPPTKLHKFCWFNGEANTYENQIKGSQLVGADGFGIYSEMSFDNGRKLCINDGVNVRFTSDIPRDYQLLIEFTDGTFLVFTVAMYGGIVLHNGDYDNEYYQKSRAYISPFSTQFISHYFDTLETCKPTLSTKAFLATQQRFPGIGNGVVQDILFLAGIHPKSKLSTISKVRHEQLVSSIIDVLGNMTKGGGRDTERDIYGNFGGYITKMSKKSLEYGCPVCGKKISKETYLGGSVYYCSNCQPLL